MEIRYKNNKLRKLLEDYFALTKKYGKQQAEAIVSRMNELSAAESLADIFALPHVRCHKLVGDWKEHFSIDIKHPYRIFLYPEDGDHVNTKTITVVRIEEIIDPH